MTVFPDTNTSALFGVLSDSYFYPYCGADPHAVERGCCISSEDLGYTLGLSSVSYTIEPNILARDYWELANKQSYCKYESDSGDLLQWGYITQYVLADSNCYNGFACYNSKELQIFTSSDCSDEYESIILTTSPQIVYSRVLNTSLSASYYKFIAAGTSIHWTVYFPFSLEVPNFKSLFPLEYVGLISYIISLLLATYVATIYLRQYFAGEIAARYVFLSQALWIIWLILNMIYWISTFPNDLDWQILLSASSALYNIASMISVTDTFFMILNFFHIQRKTQKIAAYAVLVAIHLAVAGSGYLMCLTIFESTGWIFSNWQVIFPLWNLFQFSINTYPAIYILYKIICVFAVKNNKTIFNATKKVLSKSPMMSIVLPIQLSNTVLYMLLSIVSQYTEILENDRNYMAWNGLMCLANIIHEILNLSLMIALNKLILKIRKQELTDSSKIDSSQIEGSETKENSNVVRKASIVNVRALNEMVSEGPRPNLKSEFVVANEIANSPKTDHRQIRRQSSFIVKSPTVNRLGK
ncbi:hypothetical protein HDV06_003048 [Boothiomyces sp. JEL0866]|nr:hypothetical protein HDV06_003048 [Boothiomyces sp. JEL0866]